MPAAHPIARLRTDVATLAGVAGDGPILEPTRLTSFADYELSFGVPVGWLGASVRGFFANGGAALWVVRAAGPSADELGTAVDALEGVDEFALAACPDALALDHDGVAAVAARLAARCEASRALAVVDLPQLESPEAIARWRLDHVQSSHAAAVAPLVRTADALGALPPSGMAIGALAARDRERGVPGEWTATRPLAGLTDVEARYGTREAALLNARGVNVIRSFPTGFVVWGGRTATDDPDVRYVAVRRLLLFLESTIERGLEWAVSEPNEERTWAEVRLAVAEFLNQVWAYGALVGQTPDAAYFVRCGRDTMTQDDIDSGTLIVLVGVAPIRPAEFVVLRIRQTVVGATP